MRIFSKQNSRPSSPLVVPQRGLKQPSTKRAFGVALGVLLGTGLALPAQAADDSLGKAVPWTIDVDDPVSSVPSREEANKNPMGFGYFLMSLADGAEAAEEKEDWVAARRFYQAIAKGAPTRAVGFEKVCEMDFKLGEFDKALDHCYRVLSLKGVEVRDFMIYIKAITSAPTELGDAHKDKALKAMDHFEKAHPVAAMRGRCVLGMHYGDQALLERCVPAVLEAEEGKLSEQALSFAWRLSVMKEDWDAAQGYVDQLKPIASDETIVVAMEQAVQDGRAKVSGKRNRWVRRGLLAAVILGLYFWWRRRKEEESAQDPS